MMRLYLLVQFVSGARISHDKAQPVCPAGWVQVGDHTSMRGDPIAQPSGTESPAECSERCDARTGCRGFVWAEVSPTTYCMLYDSYIPTVSDTTTDIHIFCKREVSGVYNFALSDGSWTDSGEESRLGTAVSFWKGGTTCPGGSDVSEEHCLAAAQSLLASGQTQGRTFLVAGRMTGVPPGCSIQSHGQGNNGDFAAHYNHRSNAGNNGGYTKVCETSCQTLDNVIVVGGMYGQEGFIRRFRGHAAESDEECSGRCTADAECTAWVRGNFIDNPVLATWRWACQISRKARVNFAPISQFGEGHTVTTAGLRCN